MLDTIFASTFDTRIASAFGSLVPVGRPVFFDRLRYARYWGRWLWRTWSQRFFEEKLVPVAFCLALRPSVVRRVKQLGGGVRWGEYGPCLAVPEFVLSAKEIDLHQTIAARPRIYAGSSVDLQRDDGEYDFSWLQGVTTGLLLLGDLQPMVPERSKCSHINNRGIAAARGPASHCADWKCRRCREFRGANRTNPSGKTDPSIEYVGASGHIDH